MADSPAKRDDKVLNESQQETDRMSNKIGWNRLAVLAALVIGWSSSWGTAAEPIRLWDGDAPGALGKEDPDVPTLTPYLPASDKASGTAIVVCPGGGYGGLAGHEGEGYAKWLADNGVAAFVLKYRLGSGRRATGTRSCWETLRGRFASCDRRPPTGSSTPSGSASWGAVPVDIWPQRP